jgi:hypothetical protein
MIHLQGVGQVDTVKASELVLGDIVMFNGGVTDVVHSFGKETAKFMEIGFYSPETKTVTVGRYKKDKAMCRLGRS